MKTKLGGEALNIDDAANEISKIVAAALLSYRENPALQPYLDEVINLMCRRMEVFVKPLVSKRARAKAMTLGLELTTWRQQPKWDKGRKIFHLDPCFPVYMMKKQLLALADPTPTNVKRTLKFTQVAWILKDEDRKLTCLGYRHSRQDWTRCYDEAKIELEERRGVALQFENHDLEA